MKKVYVVYQIQGLYEMPGGTKQEQKEDRDGFFNVNISDDFEVNIEYIRTQIKEDLTRMYSCVSIMILNIISNKSF